MGFFSNYKVCSNITPTITSFRNTYVLTTQASNVPIGIPSYNSANDILLVIKNTATLAEGVNYKIATNGTSIDSLEGVWDGRQVPITFHFIVIKNATS